MSGFDEMCQIGFFVLIFLHLLPWGARQVRKFLVVLHSVKGAPPAAPSEDVHGLGRFTEEELVRLRDGGYGEGPR